MHAGRIVTSFIAGSLAVWCLMASADEPAPRALLLQMANAVHTLDYKGRFTHQYHNSSSTFEVVHQVVNGVETERLVSLDGSSKEIRRHGHAMACLQTGEKILRELLNPDFANEFGKLEDHYNFRVTGVTRVAGRAAWVLDIQPRDEFRLGYTLAIDQQTGLWLQNRVQGAGGAVLESFQFVSLQVGGITAADMTPAASSALDIPEACRGEQPSSPAVTASQWKVNLPPGFVLSSYEKKDAQTEALVFTDGLSSFTLFLCRESMHELLEQHGGTLVFSRRVTVNDLPYMATVVGEVPEATAKRVILSLSAVSQKP